MKVEITIKCPCCSSLDIKKTAKRKIKNKIIDVTIAEDSLLVIII